MYSVVLMVAMTSSVDLPDCHKKRGGRSCCAPVSYACGCAPAAPAAPVTCGCVGTPAKTEKSNGNGNGTGTSGDEVALTTAEEKEYQEILKGLKGKEKKELEDWWKEATNKEKREYLKGDSEVKGPTSAKLIVKVPASARLSIGGVATVATSTERTFVSPVLVPGQSYYYTIQATFEQAGKSVVVTREVEVRAGKTTQVNLGASRTVEAVVRR